MLLLEDDVKRIARLGFKEEFFSTESDGFKVLKNSSAGRCVFHDGKQCTIYANRPKGCKFYPIVFDEDLMLPVKDDLCPYRNEFGMPSKSKAELRSAYRKFMEERLSRITNSDNLP
jgi:uncharacterized protein